MTTSPAAITPRPRTDLIGGAPTRPPEEKKDPVAILEAAVNRGRETSRMLSGRVNTLEARVVELETTGEQKDETIVRLNREVTQVRGGQQQINRRHENSDRRANWTAVALAIAVIIIIILICL